jgi:site-specific DNA-methyltransferase (adenine-specific)
MNYTLHEGDCLEVMAGMEAGSVDAVITDPPYGTTACKWDSVIPFMPMWDAIKHVLKPRGAVVLFGSQPFTSALVMSNVEWFKYCWVWDKNRGNGHLVAKFRPLQRTEDVAVFGDGAIDYFPQMEKRAKLRKFGKSPSESEILNRQNFRLDFKREDYTHRFPTNILHFPWAVRDGLHPTQKPVALLEYLIRTYTNKGDTVLDFTMGSGTTGVAAMHTGRKFIGVEMEADYFQIAKSRIEKAAQMAAGEFVTKAGRAEDTDGLPMFGGEQ